MFDEGRYVVSRLVLFSTEDLMALVTTSVSPDNAAAQRTSKDKGGRPAEYDWSAVKEFTLALVKKFGPPGRANKRFPTKNDLITAVLDEWANRDIHLAEPTVRRYVGKWLGES